MITTAFSRLAATAKGPVLTPSDPGYDTSRSLWNARFDRRPDAVVRCRRPEDVQAAVRFARLQSVELSVRGGGHAFAANTVADGGLLLDLTPMRGVEVDAGNRVVRVEAGATWRDVDAATQEHGLATPGGTSSGVGVAGFTLGGGMGYLSRRHGLAVDNLLAVELVTADGDVVRASADENTDLFWALRGGGGNFGVATALELALHRVGPQVLAGQVLYRLEDAPKVLRRFREAMPDAPDEVQCYPFFLRVPPLEMFPTELHGEPALDLVVFHVDPDGEGDLAPLLEVGEPFASFVAPQPYVEVQQVFDAGLPKGQRYDSRAHDLASLDDDLIATLVEHASDLQGELTVAYLSAGGGAVARIEPTATAFPHRDAPFSFHLMAGWLDPDHDDTVTDWCDSFAHAVAPHATGGVYVNVLGTGEASRVKAAYGSNYGRLAELKREWDPENLFRGNHNIPPAESAV